MIPTALETNLSETLSFASLYANKIAIGCAVFIFFSCLLWLISRYRKISPRILNIFALLGFPILVYQAYLLSNKVDCRFNAIASFVLPFRYGCEFYGAFEEISNAKKAFLRDQIILAESASAPLPLQKQLKILFLLLVNQHKGEQCKSMDLQNPQILI